MSFFRQFVSRSDRNNYPEMVSALFIEALAKYLEGDTNDSKVTNLRASEVQPALHYMQSLYNDDRKWATFAARHCSSASSVNRNRLILVIVKLSQQSGELPQTLSLRANQINLDPDRGGTNADVFRGRVHNRDVAIKRLRNFPTHNSCLAFSLQALLWRQMRHKNVLELLGIDTRQPNMPRMILPWMEHGSIRRYMATYQSTGRQKKTWLSQTANGLNYLHDHDVVHGDLRGANIMISPNKIAQITDFGLAVFAGEKSGSFHSNRGEPKLWNAPELFDTDVPSSRPTKKSDVYSFGVLCCEVYSEADPEFCLPGEIKFVDKFIVAGSRPERPSAMEHDLFQLVRACWDAQPGNRPDISEVATNSSLEP